MKEVRSYKILFRDAEKIEFSSNSENSRNFHFFEKGIQKRLSPFRNNKIDAKKNTSRELDGFMSSRLLQPCAPEFRL